MGKKDGCTEGVQDIRSLFIVARAKGGRRRGVQWKGLVLTSVTYEIWKALRGEGQGLPASLCVLSFVYHSPSPFPDDEKRLWWM